MAVKEIEVKLQLKDTEETLVKQVMKDHPEMT
jgi:hypothetical protein